MWPDVEEQVAIEQAQIAQLFEAYQAAINKSSQQEPDFFRHAYSFQLEWDKMQDLVLQSQATWQRLQTELDRFFSRSSPR